MAVAGALRVFFKIKNDPFFETLTFWGVFDQILTYWCIFVSDMATQFRAFGSDVRSLRRKSDLAEFIRRSRQSGARAAAPNPTSLAPGARMTVVKHTPSK